MTRVRDQSDVVTSQGTPGIADSHQGPGKGKERFFPRAFRGSMALQTPKFQTFSLQNCDGIHFCCFNTVYGLLFEPPKETDLATMAIQ